MKIKKALSALSALAQESRLEIYLLLIENEEGLVAGDIAKQMGVPVTTLSFHLNQLKTAGLIESEKQGRFILYRACKKRAKKLAAFITGKEKNKIKKSEL